MNLHQMLAAPADVREEWASSPDLMSLDDKCDAVFGPLDAAGEKAQSLLIGTGDCGPVVRRG